MRPFSYIWITICGHNIEQHKCKELFLKNERKHIISIIVKILDKVCKYSLKNKINPYYSTKNIIFWFNKLNQQEKMDYIYNMYEWMHTSYYNLCCKQCNILTLLKIKNYEKYNFTSKKHHYHYADNIDSVINEIKKKIKLIEWRNIFNKNRLLVRKQSIK